MRSPVLAALLAVTMAALTTAPAFAGPSEAAFLNRLAGSWLGKGKLTGTETGPVACRLEFKSAGNRISYVGRCNIQDLGGQSFSGSIGYNDATKAYEVRSLAGSYVGTRKGDSLVFTTKTMTFGGTSTSTMTLSPNAITIDFTSTQGATGRKIRSHISFGR